MTNRWYYLKDLNVLGPFAWQQIRQMATAGMIRPVDMLRSDESPEWKPASTYGELFPADPSAAQGAPTNVVAAKPVARAIPTAPPAAPPAAKAIPAGKPVAAGKVVVPPGNVAAETTSLPVGKVSGAPPVAPPISIAVTPGKASRAGVAAPPANKAGGKSAAGPVKRKTKSSAPVVIGVVAALLLVSGLVGVMLLPPSRPVEATASQTATPVAATPAEVASTPAEVKSATAVTAGLDEAAQRQALIASVKTWHAGSSPGHKKRFVKLVRVWFTAEAAGPALALAKVASEEPPQLPAGAKFVHLELSITNDPANEVLVYKGWTDGAWLLDPQAEPIPMVPRDVVTGHNRITTTNVPGGGEVVDILSFDLGAEPRLPHRLLLPHKNFGITSAGAFGFELDRNLRSADGTAAAVRGELATGSDMPADSAAKTKAPLSEVDEVDAGLDELARNAERAEREEAAFKAKMAAEKMAADKAKMEGSEEQPEKPDAK